MSLDQLSIVIDLPARTDLVLLAALGAAGHLTLLCLDHLFDHISAYGSVLFGSQVSVVSVCKRNTQLVCYLIFKRSSAPFASGTTALLEEVLLGIIHFLLGCYLVYCYIASM